MRKRKNHMEVRGINDLGPALIHPDFLKDGLAVWAVTVTAGILVGLRVPAIAALA